jgi:hypothetical protein
MFPQKRQLTGIAAVLALLNVGITLAAQQPSATSTSSPDSQIVAVLREVSAAQIQRNIETLVSFNTRQTLSAGMPGMQDKGIDAATAWIEGELQRYSSQCGDCLQVKTDQFIQPPTPPRVPDAVTITNVYAILPGTDPANAGRIYVVSGHYDSFNSDWTHVVGAAPGANDDASGTAVSLECARVLSKHRFPATIIFLTVAGEEQGLLGSGHFAKMSKAVGWDIQGVLNNDIVGGDRTPGDTLRDSHVVRVFSEGIPTTATPDDLKRIRSLGLENDGPSRQLARYVSEVGKQYMTPEQFQPMLVFRHDRYLRGGDHFSFNEQGFPAVRFTEFRENFHHQHQNVRTENGTEYGDLPKFVDYDYTANVARLNAATLASLATAPAPPADVKLLTKVTENDSTLEWKASPGGLASSYEVLWRDTTASDWQHVQAVGNVTHATLAVSKDNVIFAVRALDAKGHRSVAVVPEPQR